ncbi:MAG: glycosyltransferase [Lachnospiraceae bacterium]|nr:glycosyltransferase [Lachnospiraceae bacterium]
MLKKEPLVSVCMPCYNHEEFVGPAIQSVLGQTYANLELIVVDDVSKDNSVGVIKSFDDPRIRLTVMEENTGFGAAEYMFRQAKGEFICWVDSDDIWAETLLEKYMDFLGEHEEYGGCVCKPFVIDKDGNLMEEHLFCTIFSDENRKKEEWFRKIYLEGNCLCSSSLCVRKSIYDQVGEFCFQYKQIHDYDYWLRFLQVAEIYMYPESLAGYRVHWEGENANFSTPSPEVDRREQIERAYILLEVMENLSEEYFVKAFSDLLRIQPGEEGFCLECEKFWIMKNCKNCRLLSVVFYYYRHYQESNFKRYAKTVYGITNNMIYELAGKVK